MALAQGTKAPAITATTDGGGSIKLSSLKGSWVVLYFYPKDDTSGCTAEACDFRDSMSNLTQRDVVVLGVSPDSSASHDKFKAKYDLNFALIADTDQSVCQAYDTWKQKSMYGRTYMGVERTTYIIDPKGTIAAVFEKVKVKGHVDEVLRTLDQLQA